MTFTLTLESADQAQIDAAMIAHLQSQGYHVAAPNENWETPGQFCKRIGFYGSLLRGKILRFEMRGGKIDTVRAGKSQRIQALLTGARQKHNREIRGWQRVQVPEG